MKKTIQRTVPKKGSGMQVFMNLYPFIGLTVVIIGFAILSGGAILTRSNITKIFEQTFALILVTTAAAFLLAQDCLDMSIGATIGMAATVAAYASKGLGVGAALFLAIAAGATIGSINGFMHGILGLNAMIATLAMEFVLRGLLLILCNSGTVGIALDMYELDNRLLKLIICIVFVAACYIMFQYHSYGKHCRAIGAGHTAAIQSGVNIRRVKVIGYIFMGATSGLAGFFTAIRTGAAMYNTGNMVEFNVLIALILGGMPINGGAESRLRCAVIGALILGVLDNGLVMLGLGTYAQYITKGIIFIAVLAMTFTIRDRIRKNQ